MSLRRITLVSIGVAALLAGAIGTAVGTPSSGVSAETARGPLVDRPLAVNMSFDPATKVKLSTKGEIEVAVQGSLPRQGPRSAGTTTRDPLS